MKSPRLVQDIQSQADSLLDVLAHHSGAGNDALLRAASMLSSAQKIIVTGMGASMFAAVALVYRLCSLGIPAYLIEAGELLHYRHEACSGSVAIVVSRSGESVEIVKLVKLLQGEVPIIGISNNPAGFLARESDVSISICSRPDEMVAIQSYTGTVLALHMLASAVSHSLPGELARLPSVLNELQALIEHELGDLESWDEFLQPNSPVYILGRGPSYASVLEGALLFHEVAKAPAVGMHAASFRHGPVEIADSRFSGIVLAPTGSTRNLNLGLARDLIRFGGKVRVIGPDGPEMNGLPLRCTPEVSDALAPLFEVIPLQCAALRLAQIRGLEIGEFRYTPLVAASEMSF